VAYLLDANCFIQAKNREYGFDFCPGYWDWIRREHGAGQVLSVESVGTEIAVGKDELSEWATALPQPFFVKPSAASLQSLTRLSSWASGGAFDPAAVNDFLSAADFFLVGEAMAHDHTVVTHEVVSATKKRIKIPNACIEFGVKFMTPYQMLRLERARFILQ